MLVVLNLDSFYTPAKCASYISPLNLPYISLISPLYLPYISQPRLLLRPGQVRSPYPYTLPLLLTLTPNPDPNPDPNPNPNP